MVVAWRCPLLRHVGPAHPSLPPSHFNSGACCPRTPAPDTLQRSLPSTRHQLEPSHTQDRALLPGSPCQGRAVPGGASAVALALPLPG